MTRILRLLLIAAIALPIWQSVAAQEVNSAGEIDVKLQKLTKELAAENVKDFPVRVIESAKATSPVAVRNTKRKASPKAAPDPVIVANGTTTNNYLPVYGFYFENTTDRYQMIYPASMLTGLQGYKIKSITFHTSTGIDFSNPSNTTYGTGNLKLTVGTIGQTSFSSEAFLSFSSIASKTITPTYGANDMTFTFDEPFEYADGTNLIFETQVTEAGSYGTSGGTKFYGIGSNSTPRYSYCNRGGRQRFLPKVTFEVELISDTEELDFGNVEVNSSKTLSATITNPTDAAVTANLSTSQPFSVATSTVTVPANGITNVNVTFSPTQATPYTGALAVDINGTVKNVPLKGVGNITGSPDNLRDASFFEGITYEWTDSEGTHINRLDEIATKPEQIIAMLREIYTNKSIPGNFKRGCDANGNFTEGFSDVSYAAVGRVAYNSTNTNHLSDPTYYSYSDNTGWNIGTEKPVICNHETYTSGYGLWTTTYNTYYAHFDQTEYKPDNEGLTMLLIELPDEYDRQTFGDDIDDWNIETYEDLLKYVVTKTMKSARVITEAKRTGTGFDKGTLFKIDCDKMNKFYLIAKGQLRLPYNSKLYQVGESESDYYYSNSWDFSPYPMFIYSDGYYGNSNLTVNGAYWDYNSGLPLYHMFEQFSPVALSTGDDATDLYQELINLKSFGVYHDCVSVPTAYSGDETQGHGHQFMMYGQDSESADCQDVRDLMFFVPDYRMMKDDDRDSETTNFLNYNANHQPTMGLYVIRQDEIRGAEVANKDMYKLTLTWDSNLDKFLPSDQQVYELLQVVVDENGVEQYVSVYYMNENGQYTDANGTVVTTPVPIELTLNPNDPKTYTEVYVPMQNSSQQVTYAVRGQDINKFLDLKVSNKRDYVIPGLDPNEMVALKDATHYSRFNAETVKNCYSNRIMISNNALGLNNNYIEEGENGTKMFVNRVHNETVNGENTAVEDVIATITFDKANSKVVVAMDKQSAKTDFPVGKTDVEEGNVEYYAGYHPNTGNVEGNGTFEISYSVQEAGSNAGNISFDALNIYDNFVVDVSENAHPNGYTYKLTTNYAGKSAVVLKTINGNTDYTYGDGSVAAIWYAWTWPTNGEGRWVKGRLTGVDGEYKFYDVDDNIKIVRMNPAASTIPSWDAKWNETGNLTVDGDTFTLNGWLSGTWSGTNDATAYSNDFRIPVYKTDSNINSIFTKDEVDEDEDGYMDLAQHMQFDAKVQYSSKTEILRYDAYRWGETETRYIVDEVGAQDAEQDLPPTGIAGNQDGSYTVSMNAVGTADYYTTSVTVSSGEDNKWAQFVDYVPENAEVGTAYTYAPVVELFTTGKNEYNKERKDYNTYGGPLQTAAVGKLEIAVVEPDGNPQNAQMCDYVWVDGTDENGDDKKYTYYNFKLKVNTQSVPPGYDIYKIRAWREIDESLLGEQYTECEGRISYPYKFEDISYPDYDKKTSYVLGSYEDDITPQGHIGDAIDAWRGTFGARKVRTEKDETGVIEELPICFYVRIYFTRNSNLPQTQGDVQGAPRHLLDEEVEPNLPADGKYYVVEQIIDYVLEGNENGITTSVQDLTARQVVDMKYYNPAGIESSTPFQGVNIVVTRYSDGSTTTTKILR